MDVLSYRQVPHLSTGRAGMLPLPGVALSRTREEPLYQQLYTQIRNLILAGDWLAGARLPSSRHLADRLGVSRNTVLLAYQRLQEDNYVHSNAGGGTVVTALPPPSAQPEPPSPPRSARAAPPARPGAPLTPGVPPVDLFPTGLWASLISRRLRVSGERILLGSERLGYGPLREAIAAHLGLTRGISCGPDQIVVTRGMDAGLDMLVGALLGPGDQVWCEEPGYPHVRRALARHGRIPCPVLVDQDGLDVAAAMDAYPHAVMAVVSPARQLPMSVVLSEHRRTLLLGHAHRTGMWLVEHENDGALLGPGAPRPLIADDPHGRVIYLGTFNTTLFPQLHVGFCVLPRALPAESGPILARSAAEVSAVTQEALADLLDHHRFARLLDRLQRACAVRHAALRSALLGLPRPARLLGDQGAAGSWLTVALPRQAGEASLVARARRAGLGPVGLARYHGGEPGSSGLVLGFSGLREEGFGRAVRRLGALMDSAAPDATDQPPGPVDPEPGQGPHPRAASDRPEPPPTGPPPNPAPAR